MVGGGGGGGGATFWRGGDRKRERRVWGGFQLVPTVFRSKRRQGQFPALIGDRTARIDSGVYFNF